MGGGEGGDALGTWLGIVVNSGVPEGPAASFSSAKNSPHMPICYTEMDTK